MALGTLDRVLDRLRVVPGIRSAAGISHHPTNSFVLFRPPMSGEATATGDETTRPAYFLVTPGFFETMRTPLVRGREFTDADTHSSRWGAVVNETMARRFWPGQDPIGQQVHLGLSKDERPRQIIGVVRDIPTRRAQVVAEPVLYASIYQQAGTTRAPWVGLFGRMTFVVRTAGDAPAVVPAIRNAVAEVEPDRPIASVSSTPVQPYMWGRYSYVFVVAGFALVALLIATFGVYGVMSYVVAQRSREIAIRLALGASGRDVIATVGRQAFAIVASGLVVGVLGALAGARMLTAQLWGVTPTDPATFFAIGVLLSIVAGAACRAPVWRALRTDPVAALKYDGGI
jgi:putative ABC transport system permease protein